MRILSIDDNSLFQDELKKIIIETFPDVKLFQTENITSGMKLLNNGDKFDIIITDLDIAEVAKENMLASLIDYAYDSSVFVVSSAENPNTIRKLFSIGIKGYITKKTSSKIISLALQLVAYGEKYLPPILLEKDTMLPTYSKINSIFALPKALTNRQSQVLDLVAQGKSNKQIAYDIGVSEATVKLHINALLRSLHVTNRTQAVITAQKMGII